MPDKFIPTPKKAFATKNRNCQNNPNSDFGCLVVMIPKTLALVSKVSLAAVHGLRRVRSASLIVSASNHLSFQNLS